MEPEIPAAIAIAGTLAYVASRRFRHRSAGVWYTVVAVFSFVAGILVALAGIVHTAAVISVAVKAARPYDDRLVFLITTGGILVFWGLLNVALSPLFNRGVRWPALLALGTTGAFMLFLALLLPLPDAGSSTSSLLVVSALDLGLLASFWSLAGKPR